MVGRWGHGWADVLALGHGAVLGPATHIFDDGKGCADAVSGGSGPFAEAMRCLVEAGWMGGPEGTEGLVQPSGVWLQLATLRIVPKVIHFI
jgi:hypothetical protein